MKETKIIQASHHCPFSPFNKAMGAAVPENSLGVY